MARSTQTMSVTTVKTYTRLLVRKRFKLTVGKPLQNASGGSPRPASPEPKAGPRPPLKPLPSGTSDAQAGHEDYLAKAETSLERIKTQSGLDLTEKVKELIHLAREQG